MGSVNQNRKTIIPRCWAEQLESRVLLSGTGSSWPSQAVALHNHAYFIASDGAHPKQVWTTDGTAAGTHAIDLGITSVITDIDAAEGKLFVWDTQSGIKNLWVTDGTAAGTRRIGDVPRGVFKVDAEVYFFRGFDMESPPAHFGGTRPIIEKLQAPAAGAAVTNTMPRPEGKILGQVNGSLVYQVTHMGNAGTGYSAYVTGGTVKGSRYLSELSGTYGGVGPIAQLGNDLYLAVDNGLWKISGRTMGVANVFSGDLIEAISSNGKSLVFATYTTDALWTSDGTAAGTRKFKELSKTEFDTGISAIQCFGDRVFFQRYSSDSTELWASDLTTKVTHELSSSTVHGRTEQYEAPFRVVRLKSRYYFLVENEAVHGDLLRNHHALWRSDGTATGTHRLWTIDTTAAYGLSAVGSRLYFVTDDSVHGHEPWTSLGTTGSTQMLADANDHPIAAPLSGSLASGFGSNWTTTDAQPSFYVRCDGDAQDVAVFVDGSRVEYGGYWIFSGQVSVALSEGVHTIAFASVAFDNSLSATTEPRTLTVNLHPTRITSMSFGYDGSHTPRLTVRADGPIVLQKDEFYLKNLSSGQQRKIRLSKVSDNGVGTAIYAVTDTAGASVVPNGRYQLVLGPDDARDSRGNSVVGSRGIKFLHANTGAGAPTPPKLNGSTLYISGTPYADVIVITVDLRYADFHVVSMRVDINGQQSEYNLPNLVINSGDGNDIIRLHELARLPKQWAPPTIKVYSGKGNDTIYGSAYGDRIDGGRGDDWMNAGGGNDTLLGDTGTDTLFGGAGNDDLIGTVGIDSIDGGTGDDRIITQLGF